MEIPTVKIVDNNRRGFIIINASDFNEKIHKVFDEKGLLVEGAVVNSDLGKKTKRTKAE